MTTVRKEIIIETYKILVEYSNSKERLPYIHITNLLMGKGFQYIDEGMRIVLSATSVEAVLREVSTITHKHGYPLLTSLVGILSGGGDVAYTGVNYYKLHRKLYGVKAGKSSMLDEIMWAEEVEKCFNTDWSSLDFEAVLDSEEL